MLILEGKHLLGAERLYYKTILHRKDYVRLCNLLRSDSNHWSRRPLDEFDLVHGNQLRNEPPSGLVLLFLKEITEIVKEFTEAGISITLLKQNLRSTYALSSIAYVLESGEGEDIFHND